MTDDKPTDICTGCGLSIWYGLFEIKRRDINGRFCSIRCLEDFSWKPHEERIKKRAIFKP